MQKPKKIFNNTDNIRSEIMEGLVYAGRGKIHALPDYCAVYRTLAQNGQTVIVSGGGSGHEPTFAGFVGEGGIDACALGEVFTSPSPDQIIEASRAVHQGNGVLFLYGNYSGDGMNFDIAAEILAEEGIECRTVRATDDIASAPPERMSDGRGVGGLAFLYKLTGAAAQFERYALPELEALANKANHNTRTIGVALSGCALPQADTFNFTLADNEIELGIGDGDHGIGIKRGFIALNALLAAPEFTATDIGDALLQSGTRLMTSMGGASGAIFGTLFRAGGKGLTGRTELDATTLAEWLAIGMQAIHQRGGAEPGDKTMVDALAAAAECAKADVALALPEALTHCAQAAMAGAEGTSAMVARFGRAKNLGERTIGHCNPGAVSMALILQFMAEFAHQN